MGGIEQAKDLHREARGLMKLDIVLQDVKYTLRTLGRDPGFTIVAVLILALGIGANVAVFSVVNTLLLRPLPFPDANQLVWIAPPPTKCGLSCATYSTDAYDTFRARTHSFQDVTGYFAFSGTDNLSLNLGAQPIPATSIDVIANFFQVLGVQPAMGRAFTAADGLNGAAIGQDGGDAGSHAIADSQSDMANLDALDVGDGIELAGWQHARLNAEIARADPRLGSLLGPRAQSQSNQRDQSSDFHESTWPTLRV